MREGRVEVQTPDGRAAAAWFTPDGAGPYPLVVQYMDAGGLRPAMTELARPLVEAGYAVLQPDLYWRSRPYAPIDARTVFSDPAERARLFALMGAVKPDDVVQDTEALVGAVDDPRVRTDRIGLVGYCMGGRLAFVVATRLGDRVAATASIHGGGLVKDTPDSPHLAAGEIRGPVYLGVADDDGSCTAADQATLDAALAGVEHRLELFEGARHGFAVPDFPVYDPAAADRQWQRVLALFDGALGAA